MEGPDEPEKGGSKDGNPMEKEADWKEVLSSTDRRNFRSKGFGKGGKGHDKGDSACRLRRQGT